MANSEPHMWGYWRDKKGIQEALEDYHPEQLAASPQLQLALAQLKNAELTIDAIMTKAADDYENNPERLT